ncbi:unnamed protein product [Caenorhabditis nigoni]
MQQIRISYECFGEATSVTSEKKDLTVDKNNVDVFCEDLAMIIKNQKSILDTLQALFGIMGYCGGEPISDTTAHRIFVSIEDALKSRSSLLQTKMFSMSFASVSQSISMIRYLDPEVLKSAEFLFADLVDCKGFISFEELKDIYRIILFLRFNTVTLENVHCFNELLTFSKMFLSLQIVFSKCHFENWIETVDPKFKRGADRDKTSLSFYDFSIPQKSAKVERTPTLLAFSETFDTVRVGFSKCPFENSMGMLDPKFEREENGDELIISCSNRYTPQKLVMVERTVNETSVSKTETRKVLENPLTMKIILNELDCFDMLKLRKVSSGIRNCVDDLKPDTKIKSFTICLEQHLNSTLIELTSGADKEIKYFPANTVGLVNKHYFFGLDARTQSLKDAETILKNLKTCIEELRLVYQCFYVYNLESKDNLSGYSEIFSVAFGEILKRRSTPLKTQKFAISCKHQNEAMAILPHIDPYSLKILEILFPAKQEHLKFEKFAKVKFEVDRISETKQWRNAEQLIGNYLIITTPIQKMSVLHFVDLEILVKRLSSEDVFYLKTNLIEIPTFQKYRISFLNSSIDESLNELIGEPYRTVPNIKKVWYFRIPDTDQYMHISLDTHNLMYDNGRPKLKALVIHRIHQEGTPFLFFLKL